MGFAQITDADRHRWQFLAADALTRLTKHALRTGLPAANWTIATTGALVADFHQEQAADRRAAFNAWADYLHADRWPEFEKVGGIVHLHAQFTCPDDDRVRGAVIANLLPDDDADQQ